MLPFDGDDRNTRWIVRIRQDFAADRRAALRHFGGVGAIIDELEFQLGGLAQQRLQRIRVLKARNLHHDPRRTLAVAGTHG